MFPESRPGQLALAFGTLILALAVALPPVSFRLTDLGLQHDGMTVDVVTNAHGRHLSTGTALHVGGCKSVGERTVCSHKELSYDHAHGLRLAATVTTQPPTGI